MTRYFCRVCDNNAGWVKPTNTANETRMSHSGNFRFGYEEWNFSNFLSLDGWQYGWIEGFKQMQGRISVPLGAHEIVLYVRRNHQALAIGRISTCEKLQSAYAPPLYVAALAGQANMVGANIQIINCGSWDIFPTIANPHMQNYQQIPYPNMRFKLSDAVLFSKGMAIPIRYTRYGALLVTPDLSPKNKTMT